MAKTATSSRLVQHASPRYLVIYFKDPRRLIHRMHTLSGNVLRPRQLDMAALFLFFVVSFLSPRTLVDRGRRTSSPDVYVATQGQLGKLCLGFEGNAPPDGTRLKCK